MCACLVFDYNSIKTQADKTIKFALSKHRRTFAQHLKSEPYKDMPQNTLQHCRHRTLSGCIYICFHISYGKYNSKKIIQFQKGVATLQVLNYLAAFVFVSVLYSMGNTIPEGCCTKLSGYIYICFYISYGKYNSERVLQCYKHQTLWMHLYLFLYPMENTMQCQKGVTTLNSISTSWKHSTDHEPFADGEPIRGCNAVNCSFNS